MFESNRRSFSSPGAMMGQGGLLPPPALPPGAPEALQAKRRECLALLGYIQSLYADPASPVAKVAAAELSYLDCVYELNTLIEWYAQPRAPFGFPFLKYVPPPGPRRTAAEPWRPFMRVPIEPKYYGGPPPPHGWYRDERGRLMPGRRPPPGLFPPVTPTEARPLQQPQGSGSTGAAPRGRLLPALPLTSAAVFVPGVPSGATYWSMGT